MKHVRTVVLDQSRTEESRQLVRRLREHEPLRHRGVRPFARRRCGTAIVAGARVRRHRDPAGLRPPAAEPPARRLPGADRRLGLLHRLARRSRPQTASRSRARSRSSWCGAAGRTFPSASHPAHPLQSGLAQREPADPRARRDPADVLGHAPRRLRDRPRARARHARAAHGDARLPHRRRARQAPAVSRARLRPAAADPRR